MTEDLQRSLERYDVLDRIAIGGMAEVFLAKAYGAHGFEKTLAIKRILPELARDPEFEERFIAEAKVAVRLSHANVVQVFDFGRFEESLFIAMEYVDGLDLAALLRRIRDEGRQVPLPAAFHISIEIMRGLDFAHQHGVVHRDVSPSNILLSRAGEVKIADFGIAVAARGRQSTGTGPRKVMGKWRYMSPEQARGDRLDTRSDLFSAASVIFELFTGAKLFPGVESDEIIKNINEMAIPKVGSVRPGLPSRLDEILSGPLARRPLERPNRPALTLRSLIELSYESSIVATALDVAETVNSVLPPREGTPRSAIDDVLRKEMVQLGESSMRRTAVTSGQPAKTGSLSSSGDKGETTGLWLHHVDEDGTSRLQDLGEGARAGDDPGAPRTRDGARVAQHQTGDVSERFRRTEVGATPQSREDNPVDRGPSPVAPTRPLPGARRGRALWVSAVGTLGLAFALALWRPWHHDAPAVQVVPSPVATVSLTGVLDIDSDPSGATGAVDGVPFGPTPSKVVVPAGVALKVVVEKAGHEAYRDDHVEVPPGQTVRMRPVLTPAPARLLVSSDPAGAQVTLGGRQVGTTPLELRNLEAAADVTLSIAHEGFVTASQKVTLRPGQATSVREILRPGTKYGKVDLYITDGWAEIFLNRRKLGRAPVQGLVLPVGKQRLLLVNPLTGLRKTFDVVVDERKPSYYRTTLGS